MKLFGCAKTRSDRVRWVLEEIGVPYTYVPIDLVKGEGQSAQFLALNPSGKVPALEVDGVVLTESAALCRFLADRHPEAKLAPPPGTLARARMDQWCDFAIAELEQSLWTLSKHRRIYPEDKRVPTIEPVALWEFDRAARLLAQGLGSQETILGQDFTVADILLTHILAWAKGYQVMLPEPSLVAYMERHLARPALARVREKNKAETRV